MARLKPERSASFELDDRWLPGAGASYETATDGPKRARDLLAKKGIVLIVERHLPGSYLDGAAMLADGETPVVGLTLRHDRLDNFWFVLMHELGHVFQHLFDGLRFDFFDEEGGNDDDAIEAEADKFALDALIPEALWDQCLSAFRAVGRGSEDRCGDDRHRSEHHCRAHQEGARQLHHSERFGWSGSGAFAA